ncbi:MAG: hypothetical protein QOI97_3465 [Pseudomonas sp.]|nr:hypothetical protein [Pseudomonas sp.]
MELLIGLECSASDSTRAKCGSGLARECSGSINTSLPEPPHSRASPAPTFELRRAQNSGLAQNKCGSGLARECGGSINTSLPEPPPSRASPAPTFALQRAQNSGLAQKQVWELACLRWWWGSQTICCRYTAIASKPGSHLGTAAGTEFRPGTKTSVRAGLLANAVGQSIHHCLDHRHREQARLPHRVIAGAYRSVVVPLHFKHHFIHWRGKVAVLALGAQA